MAASRATLIAALQEEHFADDLLPPAESTAWSDDDVTRFFESGGEWQPDPPAPAALALRWDADAALPPLTAQSTGSAHGAEGVASVRLLVDTDGVIGSAGSTIALSSSWDATAKLWRLDPAPSHACTLYEGGVDSGKRWVYDSTPFTMRDGTLGVATVHTGGWVGEPEELIRLWRVGDDGGSGLAARTACRLNTVGARATPPGATHPCGHMRGVHAVEARGGTLFSLSDDALLAWALDGCSGVLLCCAHGISR